MDLTAEIKISENVLSLFGALYLSLGQASLLSLACQTFHSAKGEEKSGNLPIPFWFAELELFCVTYSKRNANFMLSCSMPVYVRVGFGRGLFY